MNSHRPDTASTITYTRRISRSRLFYYVVSYAAAAGVVLAMTGSFGSQTLVVLVAATSLVLPVAAALPARRYLSQRYVQLADGVLLVCSGRAALIRLNLPGDISSATVLKEIVTPVHPWRFWGWKSVLLIETTSDETIILDSEQYGDGEDLISDVLVRLRALGVEVRKA